MTSISLAIAAALIASNGAKGACKADSYRQLLADFPDAVRYDSIKATVEFCPDNTCHKFAARRKASCDAMVDFLVLYLRYFSEYNILNKWRPSKSTSLRIEKVLSKQPYVACTRVPSAGRARCAVGKAKELYGIVGYDVRYDEGEAIMAPIDLDNMKQAAQ